MARNRQATEGETQIVNKQKQLFISLVINELKNKTPIRCHFTVNNWEIFSKCLVLERKRR